MRRRKKSLIGIVILIVLFLGIGYAYLTTTLSINGTTDVDANTWDVYWNNVQVSDGSVTGSQVTQAPTIDTNKTTVSFQVRLSKPGDYYEFTVDAVNAGTLDAMVETVTLSNTPNYINYVVSYGDNVHIVEGNLIAANTTETYKVRVEYNKNINIDDLPSTAQSLNLSFGVEYVQADSFAKPIRETIYNVSETSFNFDYEIPDGVTTYSNYQDAITAFGHPTFLKHIIGSGVVADSYVGFVYNNNVYYLRSRGSTYNFSTGFYNGDSIYYESNKEILRTVFGDANCTEEEFHYSCYTPEIHADIARDGSVAYFAGTYVCLASPLETCCGYQARCR